MQIYYKRSRLFFFELKILKAIAKKLHDTNTMHNIAYLSSFLPTTFVYKSNTGSKPLPKHRQQTKAESFVHWCKFGFELYIDSTLGR